MDIEESRARHERRSSAPKVVPRQRRRPLRGSAGAAFLGLLALFGSLTIVAVERDAPSHGALPSADPTPGESHTKQPQRWFQHDVAVVIDDSMDRLGPTAKLAVEHAFGEWLATGSNLPALSFTDGHGIAPSLDPDGVNSVIYAPIEFEGHRDDLAITIGFSDDETGEITEADIIINARQPFASLPAPLTTERARSCNGELEADRCDHVYDLQNVLTHEVGHFYGLGEDENDRTATMFSCTSPCETHKRRLGKSDVDLISSVYASDYSENWARVGCSVAEGKGTSKPAAWAGCLLLGLLALGRRRPRAARASLSRRRGRVPRAAAT